jgi:hypothetical protein
MVGMPPVFSKNRFVQRSQSFTSLSWSELAELSLQKESSNSTALLVSFINKPYQLSRAQMAPPRSTAQSHDFVVVLSLSLLYEELLQHSRRKSRVTSATLAGDSQPACCRCSRSQSLLAPLFSYPPLRALRARFPTVPALL